MYVLLYETRVDYCNLHAVGSIQMISVNVSSSIETFDYYLDIAEA